MSTQGSGSSEDHPRLVGSDSDGVLGVDVVQANRHDLQDCWAMMRMLRWLRRYVVVVPLWELWLFLFVYGGWLFIGFGLGYGYP